MKRAVFLAAILVSNAFARYIAWRATDTLPVSLQSALEIAKDNLKDESYYCIGASLAKTFRKGDWELHYCTKDGKHLWVSVASDKTVKTSPEGYSC